MKQLRGFFFMFFYKTVAKSRQDITFAQTLLDPLNFNGGYFEPVREQTKACTGEWFMPARN